MKNRLTATLLAGALAVSMLSCVSFAAQDETEALEAVLESATEAAAAEESITEAAETEGTAQEAEPETAAPAAADPAAAAPAQGGQYAQLYEPLKANAIGVLQAVSNMSEADVQNIIDSSTNESEVRIAANWQSVAKELGHFTGSGEQTVTENGNEITVVTPAEYDGTPEGTTVNVSYVYNAVKDSTSMSWDVQYPKSKLFREAGLNTLLGLGIVFLTLVFLSFIIGQLHWIPDLIEGKKKSAPAPAPAAAPAPAPAPVIAEPEDVTDDLELAAVIAAAIAASEEVPADGFVVRSIRKVNRRKRPNA